jgi:hypothetical protein
VSRAKCKKEAAKCKKEATKCKKGVTKCRGNRSKVKEHRSKVEEHRSKVKESNLQEIRKKPLENPIRVSVMHLWTNEALKILDSWTTRLLTLQVCSIITAHRIFHKLYNA